MKTGIEMADANRWKDHYTRKAREEKWLARSVYKLEEIDRKHKLIQKGFHLLDLGCYPGSWSQYAIKKVGESGKVVGIDMNKPERLSGSNFRFIKADILDMAIDRIAQEIGEVDAVISDLAPKTTGIKITDSSRSLTLAEKAFEIAVALLKKEGHFLCKILEGGDIKIFKGAVSQHFNLTRLFKPEAVRKKSKEIYIIGLGFNKYLGGM